VSISTRESRIHLLDGRGLRGAARALHVRPTRHDAEDGHVGGAECQRGG
jgi:hypothetical protein